MATTPAFRAHPAHLRALALGACLAFLSLAAASPASAASAVPLGRAASAPPELAFEPDAVVAEGMTPGGEVLVFAVGRSALTYATRVHHWEVTELADGAGELRFEVPDGVPPASLWAMVDLATGELLLAPGPGLDTEIGRLPPGALHAGPSDLIDRIAPGLAEARVLLVRPGVGAWTGHLADGGLTGSLDLGIEELHPAGGASPEPPEEILPRDVVVVFDPQTLRAFSLTAGPPV